MAWEYSEKVKDLFMKALTNKEESHFGTIDNPDGTGSYGSIACGDAMVFYFKVNKDPHDPKKDMIIQTRYKTFGCTSAIASSEALCIMIEEQKLTPLDAMKITSQDIVDFLGGMPTQKIHCSVMGTEVLKVAVSDWAKKRNLILPGFEKNHDDKHDDDGKMVCHCFGLSDSFIKRKVQDLKLTDSEQIKNSIKAGGGCGLCVNSPDGLNAIIQEVWGKTEGQMKKPDSKIQKIHNDLIKEFEGNAKSRLNYVELVDIKDNMVYCIFENLEDKKKMEDYLHSHVDINVVVIDV